ncbi:TIGR03016 family PEP-CTERM system-associated outer membrane protein [Photobacterium galatheae]|uniref:TIGR03016 family PEP-CTERM system-associated outer membrane protein n=1 Tax=Photobacterium galatheae TaxID=1654360 RepID=UPI0013774762|nr:TIGR03016 family PEP-CTERM system-associated outer membrane protein [Photobacterium galatheae]MCM0149912.1 TIGR03016 family PEP-CTERM system-associated outer membrane protein [Photobacterium galatheae]
MARQRINPSIYLLGSLSLIGHSSQAANVELTPYVGTELTFTDNVNRTKSDKQSSLITALEAGVGATVQGSRGYIGLDYDLSYLYYDNADRSDKFYQSLDFYAFKGLGRSGFQVDASASIENIATDIATDANADVISGDTIESNQAEVGLSYRTNPLSTMDLRSRVYTRVIDNEDEIGNYTGWGGNVTYANGRAVKDAFWLLSVSYDFRDGKDDGASTELSRISEILGLQTIGGFAPFLRLNYENYNGVTDSPENEIFNWGVGTRYFWDRYSYLDVSYNFSEDDVNSDFWAGSLNLSPNDKTRFYVQYDKRLRGDAYTVEIRNRSRRWTNTLTYEETPDSYERERFVEGGRIDELYLRKEARWLSELELRRTRYSFSLYQIDRETLESLSDLTDDDSRGVELDVNHRLSRALSGHIGYGYERYEFTYVSEGKDSDDYHTFSLDATYAFRPELVTKTGVKYYNRSSSNSLKDYDETRLFFDVRVEF